MSKHLDHKGYVITGNVGNYLVFDPRSDGSPPVFKGYTALQCLEWVDAYVRGEAWALNEAVNFRSLQQ